MNLFDRLCRSAVRSVVSQRAPGQILFIDDTNRLATGSDHQAVVRVLDSRFYRTVALGGALGAAEAYRLGYWEADDLVGLMRRLIQSIGHETWFMKQVAKVQELPAAVAHRRRRNTKDGSQRNIRAHYDLGNDLFETFLDPTLSYSCAYFDDRFQSLEDASINKLKMVCEKLDLQPGMTVAETGTGWGSLALMIARDYDCSVTTVTLSVEQYEAALARVEQAGLNHKVKVLLQDYRDLDGQFDRLVSIEMIEAVGFDQLETYVFRCSELLKPDGLMVLQVITMPDERFDQYLKTSDFVRHYIFPGSCCPSKSVLETVINKVSDLTFFHSEDIGLHYAETLRRWRQSFLNRSEDVRKLGYSDEFIRLWDYYFSYCEAGFEERYIKTYQFTLAKPDFQQAPVIQQRARVQA